MAFSLNSLAMCRDWQEDALSQPEQHSQLTPALTQPLQDELTDAWADLLDEPADAASTAPKQVPSEDAEDSSLFSEEIGDDISEGISEDIKSSKELELKAPPPPRQRAGVEAWAPRSRNTGPRQRDAARAAQRAEPPRRQGAWTTSGDQFTGQLHLLAGNLCRTDLR